MDEMHELPAARPARQLTTARPVILALTAHPVILALFLFTTATWVYRNSLRGCFLLDDRGSVDTAQTLAYERPWSLIPPYPRSLLYLSLLGNYRCHGTDVEGYHQVNRLIHAAAGIVLFLLIRRTYLSARAGVSPADDRSATWLAFSAALLWLVHPLQTQAVTYVVQRCEAMMALCFLGCLLSLNCAASSRRPGLWYGVIVMLFTLGLGSKEVMAVAPVAMLMYDRAYLVGSWREALTGRRWLYAALLIPLVIYVVILRDAFNPAQSLKTMGFGMRGVTSWEYLRTQPIVLGHYLRLVVWPYPQCLDYTWPIASISECLWPCSILFWVLMTVTCVLLRQPRVGVLPASVFVILAPSSSIIPIADLAMEHRMYLPLAPIAVGIVIALDRGLRPWMDRRGLADGVRVKTVVAISIGLSLVLAWRTVARNEDYRSDVSMWRSVAEVAPDSARAQLNYSQALQLAGHPVAALDACTRALEICYSSGTSSPLTGIGHCNLGSMYRDLGRSSEARSHLRIGLLLYPESVEALQILAREQWKSGELDSASETYARALRLQPTRLSLLLDRASLEIERDNPTLAVSLLHTAIALHPRDVSAALRLAWIRSTHSDAAVRNGAEAVLLAEGVCLQKKVQLPRCWDVLAAAYAEAGQFEKASWAVGEALARVSDSDPDAASALRSRRQGYDQKMPLRVVHGVGPVGEPDIPNASPWKRLGTR